MMATNLSKAPFLRAVAARGYATCGPAPVGGLTEYSVKATQLSNNLVVAAAENEGAITRVSIVFRAGSRNEGADNVGVVHTLRACAGNSTQNASSFAITRNVQQVGANLTCTVDRETISYTLEGTRSAIEKTLPFLSETAAHQIFKPWEVSDIVPRQRLELALRPPQLRAVDLLHKAAFRTGLGNSLYSPKYQLGKISSETLQHYVAANFTAGRAAVVGLGVDHAQLVQYAESLSLPSGEGSSSPSPYKGGEIRSDKGGEYAFVAIAGEGGALKDPKEALAFAVLQRALGVGPQVKWGSNDNSLLSKGIGSGTTYAVSALNASYSDAGLFGALIVAPADCAGKVVEGAVGVLQGGQITEKDVARAKNQLKTAVLADEESGTKAIARLGSEAALIGCPRPAAELFKAIDGVTLEDVQAALKKVAASDLSIASVGNLRTVPFADDIGC